MFKDLKGFLRILEERDEIKKISAPVDPQFEVTEITDRVVKSGGPALYFSNVKGSNIPLVTNLLGSEKRIKLALRIEDYSEIHKRLSLFLDPNIPPDTWGRIRGVFKIKDLASIMPRFDKKASFYKHILLGEDVDLNIFPILKIWPKDGGKFITYPIVITRDPETGRINLGMYRMQVFEKNKTGMHWHIHKDGSRIAEKYRDGRVPAAVVIGADPAIIYLATAPIPQGMDDYLFGGLLIGSAIELSKTRIYGIDVPRDAEIVLEGYVDMNDLRLEGPFGDHTGYYTPKDLYPTFHIEAIYMCDDPVFLETVVGKPPMEDAFLGKATERIFLPIVKKIMPEIVDWNMPIEGGFHNFLFVSIKKRYPGHAFKVIYGLWGIPGLSLTKNIVVFDEDIDVHNISEVLWAWGNNADPERDVIIVKGPADVLDHSSPYPTFGGKMGIDATKKIRGEGTVRDWPDTIEMDEEIKKLVSRRWKEYGL